MTRNSVRFSLLLIAISVAAFVPAPCRAASATPGRGAPKNAAAAQGAAGNVVTLESPALRLEVTASPYSYRVIEKSSGEVLLVQ
ncbi:MAG: hypothetical protein ACLP1Y_14310, partial [Candidatus Acidiferrales bacterium]